jgi:ABC-type transporter Mla subunit MlaD
MSDEDSEKKIEFIIDQQAGFAARLGQIEDLIARFAQATVDRFALTDKRIDELNEKVSALIDAQIRTDESVKKTNEDLRNLIAVVDRYFSEGRNGQPQA